MIYYESKHIERNYTYTKQIPKRTQRTPNELNGLSVLFSLLLITLYSLSQTLSGSPRCHATIFDGWERVAPLKTRFRRF